MRVTARQTAYGSFPIGRDDIRGRNCCTIDLRQQTGGWAWRTHVAEDVTHEGGNHPFQLSVFAVGADLPVAEVLIVHRGQSVSIVGHATGRIGVIEITPDHLRACMDDAGYRAILLAYLGEDSA